MATTVFISPGRFANDAREAVLSVKFPDAKILVFCKAPVAGDVKTRLVPPLSFDEAAALHRDLASRMLEICLESNLAEIELWCSPDTGHEFFRHYEKRLFCKQQQGLDLGQRMLHGVDTSLAQKKINRVIVIGTDCPTLNASYLDNALSSLAARDAVLGPAEDGGYGLIGLRRCEPCVFDGKSWGSDTVFADTCQSLDELNYSWSLLPTLWDLDRPADLDRYLGST